MKKIVTKFGGSSLADAGQFRKVKDILLLDEARQYVIPSAPGRRFKDDDKVTDLLYRCHKQKSAGEDYQDTFDLIAARYMDIAEELGLHVDLGAALDEVNEKIDAGANADYCASRGEYLNGLLLADFMGWRFMDAAEAVKFTADGAFDAETTNTLMAEKLSDGVPTVVPGFYGSDNYDRLVQICEEAGAAQGFDEIEVFQSNHEGSIVDKIQEAYGKVDGIVINPAAYTHTSVAILDALKAVAIPAVEVHISAVETREDFRQVSYARLACFATITGEGLQGYAHALELLKEHLLH